MVGVTHPYILSVCLVLVKVTDMEPSALAVGRDRMALVCQPGGVPENVAWEFACDNVIPGPMAPD